MNDTTSTIPADVPNDMDTDDLLDTIDRDCDDAQSTSEALSVNELENNIESEALPTSDQKKEDTPAAILKPSGADRQRKVVSRANALRGITSFNATLNHERSTERITFFDTQTFTVHYPCIPRSQQVQRAPSGSFQCHSDDYARYPVSLLHGQFAGPYRRFTSAELNYLPLRTVRYRLPIISNSHVDTYDDSVDLQFCDGADRELFEDILNAPDLQESDSEFEDNARTVTRQRAANGKSRVNTSFSNGNDDRIGVDSKSKSNVEVINVDCALCTRKCTRLNGDSVRCAICKRVAHFGCFYVTSTILRSRISRYAWQCMECKQCEKCGGNESENLLIVCDRCDRTFHTFCLELGEIPTGSWLCPVCVTDANDTVRADQAAADARANDQAADSSDDSVAKTAPKNRSPKSRSKRRRPPMLGSRRNNSRRRQRDGAPPHKVASAFSLDSLISDVIEESVSNTLDKKPIINGAGVNGNDYGFDDATRVDTDSISVNEANGTGTDAPLKSNKQSTSRPQRTRKPNVTLSFLESPPRKAKRTTQTQPRTETLKAAAVSTQQDSSVLGTPIVTRAAPSASRSRSRPASRRAARPAPKSSNNRARDDAIDSNVQDPIVGDVIVGDISGAASFDAALSDNSVSLDALRDCTSRSPTSSVNDQIQGDDDEMQVEERLLTKLEDQRHVRQVSERTNLDAPLHPILSAAFGNNRTPLDLSILTRRAEEEVRISKIPSSTYSCSQVDTEADVSADEEHRADADADAEDAPVDLTLTASRRSASPISPTVSVRFK